ncbi:MAG: pseudoazurin [Pseudomonadota bacterium]
MILTRRDTLTWAGAAATGLALPAVLPARAADPVVHEVQMLNAHPENKKDLMVFFPNIVRAKPGDVVKFLAVDKNHNSEAFKKMLPDGVDRWKSKLGKDFELTVETEGAYGYFCTPHKSYGMVGLILVGDVSANYEALKGVRQRGKAKGRFAAIFEEADALLAAEA